jgi:hypothetical protein
MKKMINRVLLVCEVPETVRMFELALNDEEYEKILQCHGLYVNSSKMDEEQERAMFWLQEYLDDKEPFYNENIETVGTFRKFVNPITVVVSGFLL